MLEKMGWSKGKGLGANETGNVDFVRVKYKNDNIGLGYQDRDDGWTQHETNFEGLLKSLGNSVENSDVDEQNSFPVANGLGFQTENNAKQEVTNKLSGESLEQKSKKSRVRVHYKKFTRGKDLSQYSEKDLANIFGRKSLNCEVNRNDSEKDKKLEDDEVRKNKFSHTFGVTTVSTGTSINDYFKCKMALLKATKMNVEIKSNKNKETGTENLEKSVKNSEDSEEMPIKAKEREEKNGCDSTVKDDKLFEVHSPVAEEIIKKKKKKRKENCSSNNVENGGLNTKIEAVETLYSHEKSTSCLVNDDIRYIPLNCHGGSKMESKKRKIELDLRNQQPDLQEVVDDDYHSLSTKKPRKIIISESEMITCSGIAENIQPSGKIKDDLAATESQVIELTSQKTKRRKREKNEVKITQNLQEDNISVDNEQSFQVKSYNKPKKKKKGKKEYEADEEVQIQMYDKPKKEKRAKVESIDKNIAHLNDDRISENNEPTVETQLCNKPKEKKRRKKEYTLEGQEQQVQTYEKPKKVKGTLVEKIGNNIMQESKLDDCERIENIANDIVEQREHNIAEIYEKKKKNSKEKSSNRAVIEDKTKAGKLKSPKTLEEDVKNLEAQPSNSDIDVKISEKGNTFPRNEEQLGIADLELSRTSKKKKTKSSEVKKEETPENDTCIYKISGFCAEKFRHTDINGFPGSNLGEIIGYGMAQHFSLEVIYSANDEQNIADMWYFAIDKYRQLQEENQPVRKGTVNFKRYKKKKLFKFV